MKTNSYLSADVSETVRYIGVNDHEVDLFEGQYAVPEGMSYNSYVILDDKIAVMDTVDVHFGEEWMGKLEKVLEGREPDYLVIQHMEPDHSANLTRLTERYPDTTVAATDKAFGMMKQFFGCDYANRRLVVKEGDTLPLGTHTLHFVGAPMVHWPEVMVSYEASEKILFSADAFGKFGALDGAGKEEWDDEARRYYIGIVGKYGAQVQTLLKKAATLDIATICPLHGPVLREDLGHYLGLYEKWSSYTAESEGVVIAYASVYGNTAAAAKLLAEQLAARGCDTVKLYDLARSDVSAVTAEAFRYTTLVLAATTYNGDVFPPMREFLCHLTERNYANRTVAMIENGSWAPTAGKVMRGMLEKSKNLTWAEPTVRILSSLDDRSRAQITALAEALY